MKISTIDFREYRRPTIAPFPASAGTTTERCGIIIHSTTDNGLRGTGEAAPLPGFSPDTLTATKVNLIGAAEFLAGRIIPDTPQGVMAMVAELMPVSNPAGRFGLETALGDVASQAAEVPLCRWLARGKTLLSVAVNYLIIPPVDDWETVVSNIKRNGFTTVKIKVGGGSVEDDIALLQAACRHLGGLIRIRLDANRRWSYESAMRVLHEVPKAAIEYLEEPLAGGSPRDLKRLRNETGLPIALDETLVDADNPFDIIRSEYADVLVLKPMLLGGIGRTMEIAAMARSCGKEVVITSTMESEIGLMALVHLAAAVCRPEIACGLNTVGIFKDIRHPELFQVHDGRLKVPGVSGSGLPPERSA